MMTTIVIKITTITQMKPALPDGVQPWFTGKETHRYCIEFMTRITAKTTIKDNIKLKTK